MDDGLDYIRYINDKYKYYGNAIKLPEEVEFIYPWSLGILAGLIASLFIYIIVCSRLPEDLYRSLALQHLLSGCYHVTCLTFYQFDLAYLNAILEITYSCLDLVITFTTATLSWIVFLRMFMFRNGEELYSMKELTVFATLALGIIQAYEWLMFLVSFKSDLISALRMTSILLLMAIPIVVFLLLFKSLLSKNTDVPKFQALFFMAYLLLFISSDFFLLRFNLYYRESWVLLWSIFLYLRLLVEITFYVICDRYMSNFILIG